MVFEIEEKPEWGESATFVPNKKKPVYNWFYYKEGFSKELVLNVIKMFGLARSAWVLDPFCGSGTTLLACKQLGINSIGFDVLPVPVFASAVKTGDYDINELKDEARNLMKIRFRKLQYNFPAIMKRAFNRYALEDIALFTTEIKRIENSVARNFFLLALMNAAMKISYAWKDGGVIKIKKKNTPPLRFMLKRTIHRMIKEIEKFESEPCETIVKQGDARLMKIDDNTIDAIITSPPYLNNIDYTKVYEIENFIVGGCEKPALRSYIGLGRENPVEDYFDDMRNAIKEMYRVCKKGARVAIIVGNGYINGEIIESDIILSQIAEEIGFKVEKIIVLNKRFALEERTKKKGILRESIIILKK
jgi:DNA modification methylase